MSLPVLVVLVVFGIALSVAAVHLTGGTMTAELAGADHALQRFAEDFPDEKPAAVRLTADRRAAFLELGSARTGIVSSIGDCFLTRIVTARDMLALTVDDPLTISIRPDDFTWKGGRFAFADEADAKAVAAALQDHDRTREAA